jgi:hypothetical protein
VVAGAEAGLARAPARILFVTLASLLFLVNGSLIPRLTEDAVCGALYSWVMAEFDDSPEGRVFVAEMEEMRARRKD